MRWCVMPSETALRSRERLERARTHPFDLSPELAEHTKSAFAEIFAISDDATLEVMGEGFSCSSPGIP